MDEKGKPRFSAYERFFSKDKNTVYAQDAEVAFRGAILILIGGLPFLLMPGDVKQHMTDAYHLVQDGWYNQFGISCFLFAYYKDLGTTMNLAISGTIGVYVAVFGSWCLFGVYPDSITPESSNMMYAMVFGYGAFFVFIVLFLNVNANTSIFAISSFVWYLMQFMKPVGTANFAVGFEIDLQGYATKEFISSFTGSVLAILCMSFPYPITALSRATDSAKTVVPALNTAWTGLTNFACTAKKEDMNDFELCKIKRSLNQISSTVRTISGNVDTAWWECLGLGKMQRQRVMLRKMEALLSELYDRLLAVFCICVRDQSPSEMMGKVKPNIDAVIAEGSAALNLGLTALAAGVVSEEMALALSQGAARSRQATLDLTDKFRSVKSQSRKAPIDVDLLGESAFCLTVCSFGRLVADWADELASRQPPPPEAGGFLGLGSLADVFNMSICLERGHLSFVARNWISICAGFYIGYSSFLDFGPGKPSRQYNAAMASTAAVFISKAAGSAISKNLSRMQGAVLGSASGGLIYALFGTCTPQGVAGLAVGLFIWTSLTLFIYNNSSVNCGLGFLLAYFGTGAMIKGCGKSGSSGLGTMVFNLLFTVAIMTLVDTIFQGKDTASSQAYNSLISSCNSIKKSIADVHNRNSPRVEFRGAVLNSLAHAETMGGCADNEPRWQKSPWRAKTFTQALDVAYNMRYILYGLKYAVAHGSQAADKSPQYLSALECEEFQQCVLRPDARMTQVEELLQILVNETDYRNASYMKVEDEIVDSGVSKFEELVGKACKSLSKMPAVAKDSQADTLETDHTIVVSYNLAALGALVAQARTISCSVILQG